MSQFHVQIAPSRKEVGLFLEHKTRTNPVTDDAAIAKTLPRINFIGAFKARLNGHEPTFNISFIISGVIP
ncbi:hypothetical protein SARC_13992 [Sphaeroforma arctica JP610]|uniref:Uncharacterized protein n=1 Tax=Sphaeroforma arctica JP610 TaxID=667725 RepID=A0A0L0F9Q5_9EUKA|nr:hypothetical protein SARC_13992 [Sphaeroforma arctica JP610]KNC73454.1 hypothetical protein SARC_13992 [Sphaeroforma arctica JP610]|eukprot:XP_014147356.1 hypothetical protein SARC_13992 [Sphaeroforma arctica JP610]